MQDIEANSIPKLWGCACGVSVFRQNSAGIRYINIRTNTFARSMNLSLLPPSID